MRIPHQATRVFDFLKSRMLFVVALTLLAISPSTDAQETHSASGTGGAHSLQGRIFWPPGKHADVPLRVRLESPNHGSRTVVSNPDGTFTFNSLVPGSYSVVVDPGDEFEGAREVVYINEGNIVDARRPGYTVPEAYKVSIYLQPKPDPAGLTASLARVPKPAADLYNKALESSQSGDRKKAVELLKRAIGLYPEFPLALNELGVQYLKLGQPNKAADLLFTAVKLAPDAFLPRLNHGIALLESNQFAAAEKELRQATSRNASSPVSHLYLGLALMRLHNLDAAETELLQALSSGRGDVNIAHYYLGGIYWGKQQYKKAADELEAYVKNAPNAPDAQRVQETIKELRARQ